MAYVLNALVAGDGVLDGHGLVLVSLPQSKWLAPLTDEFWRRLGCDSQPLLSASDEASSEWTRVAAVVAHISTHGRVAYLEAEFFGGTGDQASAVWDRGELVLGPTVAPSAINHALGSIGVSPGSSDEFDALELGRFRSTDDWLRAARPRAR